MVNCELPVMSKQWTGQFWMFRFVIFELPVVFLTTMKWSGLCKVSIASVATGRGGKYFGLSLLLEPSPSQYAGPLPSMTWPDAPVIVMPFPLMTIGSKSLSAVVANVYRVQL